jgi:hypothetical protein
MQLNMYSMLGWLSSPDAEFVKMASVNGLNCYVWQWKTHRTSMCILYPTRGAEAQPVQLQMFADDKMSKLLLQWNFQAFAAVLIPEPLLAIPSACASDGLPPNPYEWRCNAMQCNKRVSDTMCWQTLRVVRWLRE